MSSDSKTTLLFALQLPNVRTIQLSLSQTLRTVTVDYSRTKLLSSTLTPSVRIQLRVMMDPSSSQHQTTPIINFITRLVFNISWPMPSNCNVVIAI
jgi:ribosomal protein S18